jgi:hypothetical protein
MGIALTTRTSSRVEEAMLRLCSRRLWGLLFLVVAASAGIVPAAFADVCVSIDETRDTFNAADRAASVLLLSRQFELAGERVVPSPCSQSYTVAHVQLGRTIAITLRGPNGQRDASAIGKDDVPAVYSQMVRSLLNGTPLGAVVDRTNVSAAQSEQRRIYSDSVGYARLGFGAMFGNRVYSGPAIGVFGYRKELDAFAIDVSFLNFQYKSSDRSYSYGSLGSGGVTGAWLKLEALRFTRPAAAASPYFGGGFSWSSAHLDYDTTSLDGSGLQGELSVGYEMARASTVRVFIQFDAGLPFYTLRWDRYTFAAATPRVYTFTSGRRYVPSAAVSMGLGWQRGGK